VANLLAACGDATGPSATGSMQAYMQDEPSSDAQAVSEPSSAPASDGPSASSHGSSSYSGTLEADAQVSISGGGDAWVDLGPPSSAELDLQASNSGIDIHGQVEVPVGVYTRVRLSLSGAQARLDGGGAIGGIILSASTSLTVGANGTVVIEKEVPPFEVRADTHTAIYWDVNSHLWVNEQNVEDEEVEEQEVDDASDATTVSEPRGGDMK
jgi:hypothetical protein